VIDTFMAVYERHLTAVISDPKNQYSEANPGGYCYGPEAVPGVVSKMRGAFLAGTFNKDGLAIKRACKELGIPYTYAGIKAYLN
jgi:hypothetical protein